MSQEQSIPIATILISISISIEPMGIPICISGLLPQNGFWGFAFLCVIMGISVPFYNESVTALIQERIVSEYLGCVFGLCGSVAVLAMPVGLLISGAFADGIGANKWFLITGILIVFISVLYLITPSVKIECARVFFQILSEEGYTVYFREQLRNKEMAQIVSEVMNGQ